MFSRPLSIRQFHCGIPFCLRFLPQGLVVKAGSASRLELPGHSDDISVHNVSVMEAKKTCRAIAPPFEPGLP